MSADYEAIRARLDAVQHAGHAGLSRKDQDKAWRDLYSHAPDDLRMLLDDITARAEEHARRYRALYVAATKTRVQLAETRRLLSEAKTNRDQLQAELDARDLADLPMGGATA